jgi:ABC-type nitrate/sulfonate/bicarbonate transport system permease component
MSSPTDIEKNNLESHVELCALRYSSLETRLNTIETKVSNLQTLIENSHTSMTKVLIGTAGTVVTGVLSVLIMIMVKMQ